MIFTELALKGVYLIEPERREDERGFFDRTFCIEEFSAHGLDPAVAQCNVSYNRRRGTLRGLHYQAPPYAEAKLVRCTAGAVFDVVVDIRPSSPTFKRWLGVELSAENRKMLYIPESFAHGFQTLEDHTELFYQMSKAYVPPAGRGIRWNDSTLAISWPLSHPIISTRDATLPSWADLVREPSV
jgi:dTDP-4-dehydrorhamnose 3,5-epimerase